MTGAAPESSAVRVALWRALHVLADPPPHVVEDTIGLQLVAPDKDWRNRPDMDPEGTKLMRGSIVARARFVEELVARRRVAQYVILGAGLDTFAQRHHHLGIRVFEVDRAGPQEWKRQRLIELGSQVLGSYVVGAQRLEPPMRSGWVMPERSRAEKYGV